jgi:hypothetical protein
VLEGVFQSMLRSVLESIIGAYLGAYWNRLGVWHLVRLEKSLRASPGVYLRASCERIWAPSQAGWGCAIECNWQCTSEHTQKYPLEHHEIILGSVYSWRLRVCKHVQLDVSMRASTRMDLRTSLEVYLEALRELMWEREWSRLGVCNRVQSEEHTWECAMMYCIQRT